MHEIRIYAARFAGSQFVRTLHPQLALWANAIAARFAGFSSFFPAYPQLALTPRHAQKQEPRVPGTPLWVPMEQSPRAREAGDINLAPKRDALTKQMNRGEWPNEPRECFPVYAADLKRGTVIKPIRMA